MLIHDYKSKDLILGVEQPLISVLMTAYNREDYIGEAIESVLSSTYENFELIIVDDGSKDATVEIIRNYEKKDKRVRVFINSINLGDYPNRNKAASYAKGEFLMYVDSDDSIQSDAMKYIVQEFSKYPETKFSLIYYHGDISNPMVLNPNESIRKHFFKCWFLNVGPGGTIIKYDYFKSIGGFPEKYGPANDMYYNLKASANTNILLLPYSYLNYRVHEGQEINNRFGYLKNNYRYLTDIMELPELPLKPDEKKSLLKRFARESLRSFLGHIKSTGEFKKTYIAFKTSGLRLMDIL